MRLITAYSSNVPMDCHILKGRLETEGIPCFIYDENMIWVNPFRAVTIGGAKLKVPLDRYSQSQKILDLASQGKLIDETGEYKISEILENEIKRQNEILSIKNKIRNNISLLDNPILTDYEFIDQKEIEEILKNEKEFKSISDKKFKFSMKQFLNELFDFERSIFKYLRTKPVSYYLEKELVDNYINQKESKYIAHCPKCNSDNTAYGYAIDFKWDFLYLILSFLIMVPLFPFRKKYHCFDCGNDFKKGKTATANNGYKSWRGKW
jgi:hypothetical protein